MWSYLLELRALYSCPSGSGTDVEAFGIGIRQKQCAGPYHASITDLDVVTQGSVHTYETLLAYLDASRDDDM